MKIWVKRNDQEFGPYDVALLTSYMEQGRVFPKDLARIDGGMGHEWKPLTQLLKTHGIANPLDANLFDVASIFGDLKTFDMRILLPWREIREGRWLKDRRLMLFACVGLIPLTMIMLGMFLGENTYIAYWLIAFYFSALWGLFFYSLFKTPEIDAKTAVICFFFTGAIAIWFLLLLQLIPPWSILYAMAEMPFPFSFVGMFLGVGIHEELCKAAIIFWIANRPGKILIPQTIVFYGMMSGLGFGIYEGVHYQRNINAEYGNEEVTYLLNVLRLTSLPFIHAVWAGISAYFISFAVLAPKKRISLWLIAILIPALLHGTYNSINFLGVPIAVVSVLLLMSYLSNCKELKDSLASPPRS